MASPRLALAHGRSLTATEAAAALRERYEFVSEDEADIVVALGGDGFMLKTQNRFMSSGKPVYGMNKGTVGFLMNEYRPDGLAERIAVAKQERIHPLNMTAVDADGREHRASAINEVSLFRSSAQAARLEIVVDGRVRLDALVCDGVMVATPQGSTAYNLSAHGPILPLKSPLLALTPVSPFRPRGWRGALLPNTAQVTMRVLEPQKRPVSAVADHTEVRRAVEVTIAEDRERFGLMLFDPDHSWDERILNEQFRY